MTHGFRLRPQRGFSMLEVLIALVILSIGLLSLAALQVTALQQSYASYQRTLATIQAGDLMDRLWRDVCLVHPDNPIEAAAREVIRDRWRADWEDDPRMPGWQGDLDMVPVGDTGQFVITVRWDDRVLLSRQANANNAATGAEVTPAQSFVYRSSLPRLQGCLEQ